MNDSRLIYLFRAYFNKTANQQEQDEEMALIEKAQNDEQLMLLLADAWAQPILPIWFSMTTRERRWTK